jgi:hypothetical protein
VQVNGLGGVGCFLSLLEGLLLVIGLALASSALQGDRFSIFGDIAPWSSRLTTVLTETFKLGLSWPSLLLQLPASLPDSSFAEEDVAVPEQVLLQLDEASTPVLDSVPWQASLLASAFDLTIPASCLLAFASPRPSLKLWRELSSGSLELHSSITLKASSLALTTALHWVLSLLLLFTFSTLSVLEVLTGLGLSTCELPELELLLLFKRSLLAVLPFCIETFLHNRSRKCSTLSKSALDMAEPFTPGMVS